MQVRGWTDFVVPPASSSLDSAGVRTDLALNGPGVDPPSLFYRSFLRRLESPRGDQQ